MDKILPHTMHYGVILRGQTHAFACFAYIIDGMTLLNHLKHMSTNTSTIFDLVRLKDGSALASTHTLPNDPQGLQP